MRSVKPVHTLFRMCLWAMLALHLNACVATLYTWKETPDYDKIQTATPQEKVEFYEHHAIKDWFGGYFTTYAEPEKSYEAFSMSSAIYPIYPESAELYEEILNIQRANSISQVSWLGLILSTWVITGIIENSDQNQTNAPLANILFWSTVLGSSLVYLYLKSGFNTREQRAYQKIQAGYNAALVKHLLLSPDSLSQVIPEPTLAVK